MLRLVSPIHPIPIPRLPRSIGRRCRAEELGQWMQQVHQVLAADASVVGVEAPHQLHSNSRSR
jgi:hypothetical protein